MWNIDTLIENFQYKYVLHHISHIHFVLNVTVNSKCKHPDGRLIVDQLEFLKNDGKNISFLYITKYEFKGHI